MKCLNVILRVLSAFVAISVVQIVAGGLSAILLPPKALPPNVMQHMLQWAVLANVVTVLALSFAALRTEWRGWRLGVAVAAIPLVIGLVDVIEGMIFLANAHIEWPRILLQTGIAAVLSVPVWMLVFGRRAGAPQEHYHPIVSKSRGERAWKFVVSDFAYAVLYISAGMIIFPYVKDFYATQTVPSMPRLLALQLLIRGPVFVVLCLLLVRMLGLPRLSGALAVGAVFTLLSGVAPLILPNPYFPDAVRWVHFGEVTSSNFIFGGVVAWLWGQAKLAPVESLRQAA